MNVTGLFFFFSPTASFASSLISVAPERLWDEAEWKELFAIYQQVLVHNVMISAWPCNTPKSRSGLKTNRAAALGLFSLVMRSERSGL